MELFGPCCRFCDVCLAMVGEVGGSSKFSVSPPEPSAILRHQQRCLVLEEG